MVLVLAHVRTFFEEMLFYHFYFNDLIAFPTACQQWALFPIVDIQGLLGEIRVTNTTEVARLGALLLSISHSTITHFLLITRLTLCGSTTTSTHR